MIYVDLDNPFYKDQNGVLFDSSGESLLHFPASNSQTFYVIDHNVKKLTIMPLILVYNYNML